MKAILRLSQNFDLEQFRRSREAKEEEISKFLKVIEKKKEESKLLTVDE